MKKATTYTYQLTRFKDFITYIQIDGISTAVEFSGGFIVPYKYNGTFTTTDSATVKALEASPNFNSEYIRVSPLEDDAPDVPADNKELETLNDIPGENIDKELVEVPGITSGQKARAYLLSTFDELKSSDLRTNEVIINVASDKGISFPDWIIE